MEIKDRSDVTSIFWNLGGQMGIALKMMSLSQEGFKCNALIHLGWFMEVLPSISRRPSNSLFRAFTNNIIFVYYLFPLDHTLCKERVCV